MKPRRFLTTALSLSLLLTGCGRGQDVTEVRYAMTDKTVINPFIGFAVEAFNRASPEEHSLVYIDITFAQLQPDSPEEFDFASIEAENHLAYWRAQGKHAVLRFLCDYPGKEAHMDIPQWLYDLTGDGDFYDTEYGKGYAPNYANEIFLDYHRKALAALGEYFSDGFLSYVQLGSLGHWGEWHVLYSAGIKRLPDSAIREQYVQHYLDSFQNVRFLMRRPFEPAAEQGFGLYNDMSGHTASTREWLDWIAQGGEFTQTQEENAMVPMPDFWENAPVGGELTSSLPMWYLCGPGLGKTISLLKASHTSFLGPNCPVSSDGYDSLLYTFAVPKLLNTLGYRIGITKLTLRNQILTLQWENEGSAPIYFETPVRLYLVDNAGTAEPLADIPIDLTALLPEETMTSVTRLPEGISYEDKTLAVGIIDPMTNKPSVSLVSNQEQISDRLFVLYRFP